MTKVANQHTEPYLPHHADLQRVYEYSPIITLAIDTYGVVRYVNAVALPFIGLDKNDIIGQSLFSLYSDVDPDKSNEGKLMRLEEITDCEFKQNIDQETKKWVQVSSKVHRDQGETLTYFFIRDITAFKKKERLYSYLNVSSEELSRARDTKSALE